MQIKEATEAQFGDIAGLVGSAEELFLVYPNGRFPWDITQLKALAKVRANFTVCLVEGEISAFANLYNIVPGDTAFIGNVIVARQFQGQGIGKDLTKHMIKICQEQYKAIPHLAVFGYNARAMLLYSSLGFEPYSVEPRKNLKGENVALIQMRYVQDT